MDNHEKNLEYFKSLKYDILVRKNKDIFVLYTNELSLLVEDENIEKAYEKLESEKEKYFQKMIENGYQDHIAEPEGRKIKKTPFWDLAPFFVKLIVILSIIVIFLEIYNIRSNTFKYFKRASKDIAQASKDISQALNIQQTAVKVVDALDNYQINKEMRKLLLSKYRLLTPVDFYASNSLDDHPVKLAFDSNPGTFWHSMRHLAYLDVTLERPSKLEALSITSRPDILGAQGPDEFTIEGSNDNKNWEHIDEVSQLVWRQGETKSRIIGGNNKAYVYYRFNFIKKEKTRDAISIVEMELYGNKVTDVEASGINEVDTSLEK
jgi:hypothetical protein